MGPGGDVGPRGHPALPVQRRPLVPDRRFQVQPLRPRGRLRAPALHPGLPDGRRGARLGQEADHGQDPQEVLQRAQGARVLHHQGVELSAEERPDAPGRAERRGQAAVQL